jgi:hypothetical protein
MQSTIDKNPLTVAVENSVDKFVYEQLDSIKHELNRLFEIKSLSGEDIDDLREIQYIIDEARKVEAKSTILDRKIDTILGKTTEAIKKIEILLEKYKDKNIDTLKKIISDLEEILNSCTKKVDSFTEKLEFIKQSLTPISKKYLPNLQANSNKKIFKEWAETLEMFANCLEECIKIEIIKDIYFESIENLAMTILSIVSEKSSSNHRRDEYKRRLKFAASYIVKIIDEKDFNSDRELKREEYTIVKDLRTLAHAQYKIAVRQMRSKVNLENIERLDDDDIEEMSIDLDKIFHGRRNKAMP